MFFQAELVNNVALFIVYPSFKELVNVVIYVLISFL